MKKKVCLLVILVVMMWVPTLLFAQGPPSFDDESPYGVTDVQVPFDDGVNILIAAGVGYGLLKIRAYRKNEKLKGQSFSH